MGTHLKAGDPAPDFAARTTDGSVVRLADFRGRKLVMYFYPMDDTPGCTKEACGFRDAHAPFVRKGAVVLGVSIAAGAAYLQPATLNYLVTPMLATFMGEDTPEVRAKFLSTIPIGRFSTPEDLGNAACFLCSDEASMITGVAMEVDGGRCI